MSQRIYDEIYLVVASIRPELGKGIIKWQVVDVT